MYPRSFAVAGAFLWLAVVPAHAAMQAGQAKAKPAQQQQRLPQPQQPSPTVAPSPAKVESRDSDKGSAVSAIAGVAPIVTATLAVLFGLLAWRFNERSIRRLARQDHIRMLIDIDKIYVERPTLWRIYENEFSSLPEPDPVDHWEKARRRGLIYLYLNMFEAAYDFDRHLNWRNLNWRTQSDREYLDSWAAFVKDFFARSPEAVELMQTSKEIYSKGFVEFVDKLMPLPAKTDALAGSGKSSAASS
jgi:hypothetical protein